MTFIEAALEILRREGVPLHAKIIAEKAVDADLLSHVGKTPEQTMSKRISAAVAKGKGPFARVKPGVFALEEWKDENGKIVAPGRRNRGGGDDLEKHAKKGAHRGNMQREAMAEESMAANVKLETPARIAPEEKSTLAVTGTDMRREAGSDSNGGDGALRNRRNRNRRSKKRSRDSWQAERRPADGEGIASSQSDVAVEVSATPIGDNTAEAPREQRRRDGNGTPEKILRQENRNSGAESKNGNVTAVSSGSGVAAERPKIGNGDVAAAVEQFLSQQHQPQAARAIAAKLNVSGTNAEVIIDVLMDADNRERRKNGRRPRFVKHKSGWALSAREMPAEVVHLEDEIFQSAARLEQVTEKQLQRRLKNLPSAKLAQIVILVLRQMGYSDVEPVARGGEGEYHLRANDRRQGGQFSTAVIIRTDASGQSVTEADVSALRGALHHYRASSGIIVTPGDISVEGLREADIPNLAPVGLIDGRMLAQEMVRYGVGVEKRIVQLTFLDDAWF